jgi:hypothetical protein
MIGGANKSSINKSIINKNSIKKSIINKNSTKNSTKKSSITPFCI